MQYQLFDRIFYDSIGHATSRVSRLYQLNQLSSPIPQFTLPLAPPPKKKTHPESVESGRAGQAWLPGLSARARHARVALDALLAALRAAREAGQSALTGHARLALEALQAAQARQTWVGEWWCYGVNGGSEVMR